MRCVDIEDDRAIFEGCLKRDPGAWESFAKKYSSLIEEAARNCLKKYGFGLSSEEIEDIRQDVFKSIWEGRKLETIGDLRSLPYWLAIVAGNFAIARVRKMKRKEPMKPLSLFEKADGIHLVDSIISSSPDAGEEAARNEIETKVDNAIESLPENQKLVVRLNILYGKKYHEISEILDMPSGTVSNYIRRAKASLRKKLRHFR